MGKEKECTHDDRSPIATFEDLKGEIYLMLTCDNCETPIILQGSIIKAE